MKKKNNVLGMFFGIFLKSFIIIILLAVVGVGSYKIVKTITMNKVNEENKKAEKDDDKNKVEEKKDVIITALYCDDVATNTLDYFMINIFNTNTENMDYIAIPSDAKVKLSDEAYQTMKAESSLLPQEFYLRDLPSYYEEDKLYDAATKVLSDVIGQEIPYYEAFTKENLAATINLMDKVQFDVPVAMEFLDSNGISTQLQQGLQELSGEQVVGMLSQVDVYPNKEDERIATQNDYFAKYFDKVYNQDSSSSMLQYFSNYYEQIKTNRSIDDVKQYLDQYFRVRIEQVYFYVIAGARNTDYIVNAEQAKSQVSTLLSQGAYEESQQFAMMSSTQAPSSQTSEGETEGENTGEDVEEVSSKKLKVGIYNSTRITGLAKRWKAKLEKDGFKISCTETYRKDAFKNAHIWVSKEGMGEDLKEYFKGAEIEVKKDMPSGYDIIIVLGTDDKM